MTSVFADTFYFIALLSPQDEAHADAERFAADEHVTLVTTAWVLTELADGLAKTEGRNIFEKLLRDLESDPRVELVQTDEELWGRGVEMYARRSDKEWSLTDCISFVVMTDRQIRDALTGDHHFAQAGFRPLFES